MTLAAWLRVSRRGALIVVGALVACDGDSGSGPDSESTNDASTPADAGSLTCQVPADCKPVATLALALEPCCSATIACGYRLIRPEQVRGSFSDPDAAPTPDNPDGQCVSVSSLFRTPLPRDEKRVDVPGGEPIFYTPECATQAILAYPFTGCCMPSGDCGLATDVVLNALSILALPFAAPLTRAECTTAEKLNAALSASPSFAGFAHFKDAVGRCDYAGLVARLPEVPASSESP
jgi:hypothetical protein